MSLPEQKDGISWYATRHGLVIGLWLEERETAAKRGRPVFKQMLRLLRSGKFGGVIIHKIDRSARNLRDWADFVELADHGIDVRIATENLDLRSRSGRLTADIQAVVAADYIRNLKEEIRKGFEGRLKQGLYPLPAPVGYLDCGGGKVKAIDPIQGPLAKRTFELYDTGRFSLQTLHAHMKTLGLRTRNGKAVSRNGIHGLLTNPFYCGIIRIRRVSHFQGAHTPLVSRRLFDRVQARLHGRASGKVIVHDFTFKRLFRCATCRYSLVGERQKGFVYYRCHTPDCPRTSVREEAIDAAIQRSLAPLSFSVREQRFLAAKKAQLASEASAALEGEIHSLTLRLGQCSDRLARLTDAFIDRSIDKEMFEERKAALLSERQSLEERLRDLQSSSDLMAKQVLEFLELAGTASTLYKSELAHEKRDLLTRITSNRVVSGKDVVVELLKPFSMVANRFTVSNCGPYRDIPRTWDVVLPKILEELKHHPDIPQEDNGGTLASAA